MSKFTVREIAGRKVRWSGDQARAALEGGWWTSDTLGAALQRAAAQTPDRILLVDGAQRISCRLLYAQAAALARAMLSRVKPGSVISMMLPNWHEAAVIYHAATLAGLVVHPILPSLRERDLAFLLADADSRMIFVPASFRGRDYAAMLETVGAGLDNPPLAVLLRGDASASLSYEELICTPSDGLLPDVDPDAVRMIMYTSGTTGRPKGVLHSQNSIHALVRQLGDHWLVSPGDSFLVPSPISHIGGSIYAFELPVLLGSAAVLMEQWDPAAALDIIGREQITHMAGATPFLDQLLAAATSAGDRLPSLKLFICGGAGVPPTLIEAASRHFEKAIVSRVYGSTEVPVITVGTIDRADLQHAARTDGRVGIASVRIGGAQALAGDGEILAMGPQMLVGYHRPEDMEDAFDADGFFRTGDLGHLADGDYLVITGRAKDIIIRNGENISPKEIEDALVAHPDIAEIAIVGLPDARTGERACAVVVPRGDARPTLESVVGFLKALGYASFKLPEQLEIWAELPKNATGKVVKPEIRAALKA